MTGVMLDIGAGSKEFARLYRRYNPQLRWQFLCGDVSMRGNWDGSASPRRIRNIHASYADFAVPNASLTWVTLNASHALIPTTGIATELARTLRPTEGVFISAHPFDIHPRLSDQYFTSERIRLRNADPASETDTFPFGHQVGWWGRPALMFCLSGKGLGTIIYPASHAICCRLRELKRPLAERSRSADYIYARSNRSPTIKIWRRNDVPYNEKITST